MTMHTIEVDDDVFLLLQREATPLVDTANAVLRRLLLKTVPVANGYAPKSPSPSSPTRAPAREAHLVAAHSDALIPLDAPDALKQILDVTYRVRRNRRPRSDATHDVARALQVTFQTVLDKYTRQLNLSAERFDTMLREPSLASLRSVLRTKFPRQSSDIDRFLSGLSE